MYFNIYDRKFTKIAQLVQTRTCICNYGLISNHKTGLIRDSLGFFFSHNCLHPRHRVFFLRVYCYYFSRRFSCNRTRKINKKPTETRRRRDRTRSGVLQRTCTDKNSQKFDAHVALCVKARK